MSLLDDVTRFGCYIYQTVSGLNENIVFSPFGAHLALTVIYEGSGGTTKDVLENFIKKENSSSYNYRTILDQLISSPKIQVNFAIKLYVKRECKLKTRFKVATCENCGTEIESIDFGTKEQIVRLINDWIQGKTNGKITDLLNPSDITEDVSLILLNALHLKADWLFKFKREDTRTELFFVNDFEEIEVQMMHFKKNLYYSDEDNILNAKLILLPYKDKQFGMIVVLPNNKSGVDDLGRKLLDIDLKRIVEGMYKADVTIGLPKFQVTQEIDLKAAINKASGEDILSICDLSEMIENYHNGDLHISKAIQKTVIDVDENGTEASTATAMIVRKYSSWKSKERFFIADHPFIFILIHQIETGVIPLFMGKISKPKHDDTYKAPRGSPIQQTFQDDEESDDSKCDDL